MTTPWSNGTARTIVLLAAAACSAAPVPAPTATATTTPEAAKAPQAPQPSSGLKPIAAAPSYEHDPAYIRREVLKRLDARIDAAATQAHLDARLSLDEAMPIPYIGIDAEPAPGSMRVTAVFGATAAEAAGLHVDDLILSIDGEPTTEPSALARAIRNKHPGSVLDIRVMRSTQPLALACNLGKRPEEDEDEEEQFPDLPNHIVAETPMFRSSFAGQAAGSTAHGFDTVLAGHGNMPRWIIADNAGDPCLRQDDDDPTGIHFPMAICHDFFGSDVVASARMRYVSGRVDRAGGIVLRYRDPGNYLVARVNAAEGDLRIFRVANGLRRTLPGGLVKAPSADGAWHRLEFKAEGSKLTATFDGKYEAVAYDSYFLKGRAGVWTKSDSITEFDDITFTPIAPTK